MNLIVKVRFLGGAGHRRELQHAGHLYGVDLAVQYRVRNNLFGAQPCSFKAYQSWRLASVFLIQLEQDIFFLDKIRIVS